MVKQRLSQVTKVSVTGLARDTGSEWGAAHARTLHSGCRSTKCLLRDLEQDDMGDSTEEKSWERNGWPWPLVIHTFPPVSPNPPLGTVRDLWTAICLTK